MTTRRLNVSGAVGGVFQRPATSTAPGNRVKTVRGGLRAGPVGRRRSVGVAAFVALVSFVSLLPPMAPAGQPGAVGDLYVTGDTSDNVVQFDGQTGEFACVFVPDVTPAGFSGWANGLVFGPNGSLFVIARDAHRVREFDGQSGALLGDYTPFDDPSVYTDTAGPVGGWLGQPFDLCFLPDGRLLVVGDTNRAILAYSPTGYHEWLGTFAMGGASPGGLGLSVAMTVGPNGHVYATDADKNQVLEYHATSGRLVRVFIDGDGIIDGANAVTFGPNGNLFVSSFFSNSIIEFDGQTGAHVGTFASGGGLTAPRDITFGPNGNLFVSGKINGSQGVIQYDGSTGAVIGLFASGGGLSGAWGLAFKPAPPAAMDAPSVTGVSVATVNACTPLTGVTVTGSNLDPTKTSVKLSKAGEFDFFGVVTGGDASSLTVDFDLDGGIIANGLWGVAVTNPDGQAATLAAALDVTGCATAHDGNLLATAYRHRAVPGSTPRGIIEYDGQTGDVVGWFVEDHVGDLPFAPGLTEGPDGDIYVACGQSSMGEGAQGVVRFDGTTGQRVGVFVSAGSGGLLSPYGLTFGPNGNLFVVDRSPPPASISAVFEYDGTSGVFVRVVVERGTCDLVKGREIFFDENGRIFVTSMENGVIEFDPNGACIGVVGDTGAPTGDVVVTGGFSPHTGDFVVAKAVSDSASEYDRVSGAFVRTLVATGSGELNLSGEGGATFGPNGNYFVTSFYPSEILEYDGATGVFLGSFASAEDGGGVSPNFDIVFIAGPAVCRGDTNCDGQVDYADINGFIDALIDDIYCDGRGSNADINGNGSVGFEDINPFVELLTTNTLPIPCP